MEKNTNSEIECLPIELKQKIINYLPVKDVNNLRLSSPFLSNTYMFKNYIDENLKYQKIQFNFNNIKELLNNPLCVKCNFIKILNYNDNMKNINVIIESKMILDNEIYIDGVVKITIFYDEIEIHYDEEEENIDDNNNENDNESDNDEIESDDDMEDYDENKFFDAIGGDDVDDDEIIDAINNENNLVNEINNSIDEYTDNIFKHKINIKCNFNNNLLNGEYIYVDVLINENKCDKYYYTKYDNGLIKTKDYYYYGLVNINIYNEKGKIIRHNNYGYNCNNIINYPDKEGYIDFIVRQEKGLISFNEIRIINNRKVCEYYLVLGNKLNKFIVIFKNNYGTFTRICKTSRDIIYNYNFEFYDFD